MPQGKFCTVFNCMDGRTQKPIARWCETELGADHPDTITIAGCVGVISGEREWEGAMKHARISIEKHGSCEAVVAGHRDCAGHPVPDDECMESIRRTAQILRETSLFELVYGIFVNVEDGSITEVCRFGYPASEVLVA